MKCVVTGGGGFVGSALCRRLSELGHKVTALGRRPYASLVAEGIRTQVHDLSPPTSDTQKVADSAILLRQTFAGADCVFHTAAHVKMWGPRATFERGNIQATQNVIAACRQAGVGRLVFTSSPSVIASGESLCGVSESQPYPRHYSAFYPLTKALAEQDVLKAHGTTLRTLALRPHLIFGPGDTNLVPTILARARAGRLVQVGDGTNRVDLTFIDDCVTAHVLAAEALINRPSAGGRAYFISQGTPVRLWDWIARVLELHALPPVRRRLSVKTAKRTAWVIESIWRGLRLRSDPPLTTFLVEEMSTDHYFDISAARKELGFAPQGSVWDATEQSFA